MDKIKVFESKDFGKVQAIEFNGEWRFELYSIGMALGQVKEAKGRLYPRKERIDENVKNAGIEPVVHDGQLWITEPEMYDLMFETHTEKVKPFKKWVTSEILPTIRKTGGYVANEDLFLDTYFPEMKNEARDAFKATLASLREKNKIIKEQQKTIDSQSREIKEQKPLVEFATHVSQTKDTIDMDEMSKIARDENIDIGRNKLIKWLKDKKILKDNRTPYQTFIDRGYFNVIEVKKETTYGVKIFLKTVITGKGQIWVIEKLRAEYC